MAFSRSARGGPIITKLRWWRADEAIVCLHGRPLRTRQRARTMDGKKEDGSDLVMLCQTDIPNSYRLSKRPITKSCMRSVLAKQLVRRTNRLIRVCTLMGLLSIFCVLAFPT